MQHRSDVDTNMRLGGAVDAPPERVGGTKAMTPDEVTHKERRSAPEPIVIPLPVPQPQEPVPAK